MAPTGRFLLLLLIGSLAPGWAQNPVVFFDGFESGDTAGWWAPARVGQTGQTTCYDAAGAVIACAGTGQDGDLRPGVAWPIPRFVDSGNGTVADMLTGLVWLKDANCAALVNASWNDALALANTLASGTCGLTDGSSAGAWRLPSRLELESLLDLEYGSPALSNAAGTGQWSEGNPFSGVEPGIDYWSSSSWASNPAMAWTVYFGDGDSWLDTKANGYRVWPVRNGLQ